MEAVACRDGVRFAAQLGLQRVAIETDCLLVVQLRNKMETQRSTIDPVLREIDKIRLAFHEFSLSFISRNCNKVAHSLAKQVSVSHRSETWHVTPTCVYVLILSEASAS